MPRADDDAAGTNYNSNMLRIGPITLPTNLLLAPVAGYFDLAYRLIVRSVPAIVCAPEHCGNPQYDIGDGTYGSVGMTCTELICPQAIVRASEKTLQLAATSPEDQPACIQIYGADADILRQAAQWAQTPTASGGGGASVIDINMGCPVDKVTKKNGGSKLLCDPKNAVAIAKTVVDAVDIPVTCKIRLGWDDDSIVADSLPAMLCDVGVQMITVHGRTAAQRFKPSVRLDGISQVVENVKHRFPNIPVIGNGDIHTPEDAKKMLDVTGCDGVMIARGAIGQPWLFRDTAYHLKTGQTAPPLPRIARAQLVLDHFENLLRFRSEKEALHQIRFRIAKYSVHLQPWPGLRRAVQPMREANAFRNYWLTGMEQIAEEESAVAKEY